MAEELLTKDDIIGKLTAYAEVPDDENLKYKEKIKDTLLHCPELLFALNETDLADELISKDGTINYEGEWDRYFGESSNIRPYLFFPETQEKVKHYLCYQVSFTTMPKYNNIEKYTDITFHIFVHGKDSIDPWTQLPRHDLIASIIRERFNWSSIFGMQAKLVSSKESMTDNNYVVRTLVFKILDPNGLVKTDYQGETTIHNTDYWR